MKEETVLATPAKTRTVAVIYIGGTVGSRGKKFASLQTSTSEELRLFLLKNFPETRYQYHHPLQILSEDATPETWMTLAKTIQEIEKIDNPDSYLIFHGTDTMTWTAAALSFLLDIEKPIVLTGSEYPLDHPLTDAFYNAGWALKHEEPGVAISFRGEIFSSTRSRKDPSGKHLFSSFERRAPSKPRGAGLYEVLGQDPIWIRPAPGLDLPAIQGPVLLEMYPSWTVPESWAEELLHSPYPLFLTTHEGILPNTDYPSLRTLEKKGILLPMLPETAWSKLLTWPKEEELNSWMRREVAGEFLSR